MSADLTAVQRMGKLVNLSRLLLNSRIDTIWKNPENETTVLLKEVLTIGEKDTINEVVLKNLVFFLACDKLPASTDEIFIANDRISKKDPLMLRGKCAMRPELKYATNEESGKTYPIGNRNIDIPHILENQLAKLHGLHIIYGQQKGLYVFTDGSQLKINAITEKEAHRVINHCLLAVDPKWLRGSSEENTYFGKPPKRAKKSPLHGMKANIQRVDINNQHGKITSLWV
jgi:hypothetical protein